MIFIKNILKKKNIKNYFFTTLILIIFSLFFSLLVKYLEIYKYNIDNEIEKRTIIISERIKCNEFTNEYIVSCKNNEDESVIVVNQVDNISKFIDEYPSLDIITVQRDESLNNLIDLVELLSILVFLSCIFLIMIQVFQNYKDDIPIMKILRCIGYSKLKIFLINISVTLSLITFLYVLSFIFFVIVLFILNLFILIPSLLFSIFSHYVIIISLIIIYYLIIMLFTNSYNLK